MVRYEVVYPRKWIYTGVCFPAAEHLPYAAVWFSEAGEWLRTYYFDTAEQMTAFIRRHDTCDCRSCTEACTAKWKTGRYAPEQGGKGSCLRIMKEERIW